MPPVERVINKALSGIEVKELIRKDINRLLDEEGYLTDYVAYGRVAWRVNLRLQMENFMKPESQSLIDSKQVNDSETGIPTAVEAFPLLDTKEDIKHSVEVSHSVSSPNAERLSAGMPIPVEVRQHDGTVTTEQIKYPESGNANTVITETKVDDWGKHLL